MRTLLLLRHGKSDWDASYGTDHDRPLAKRGRRAAAGMGRFLTRIDAVPDVILSSTALRAHHTARLAAEAGGWECPLELAPEIYGASAGEILDLVRQQSDTVASVLMVGHEPTWSELIRQLTGARVRFPTAALTRIDSPTESWQHIGSTAATLVWLVTPKLLAGVGFGV